MSIHGSTYLENVFGGVRFCRTCAGSVAARPWANICHLFSSFIFCFFFYFLRSVERPSLWLIHEQSVSKNSYREPVTFLAVALASYVLYCAISPSVVMQ